MWKQEKWQKWTYFQGRNRDTDAENGRVDSAGRERGWTERAADAAAKSLQSCPTLCDPIDGSPPGSPVPGILQVRTLEWVAISFSNAWQWKVKVKSLLATPWTAAYQAPASMGFSRQEHWSGGPLPSPIERAGWTYAHYHWQLVGTCCTAQGAQLSDDERFRGAECGGGGKEVQEGGDIWICIADSLPCIAGINTTL